VKHLFLILSLLGLLYASGTPTVPHTRVGRTAVIKGSGTTVLHSGIYTATTDGTPIPR
jgi:hypothetical protein